MAPHGQPTGNQIGLLESGTNPFSPLVSCLSGLSVAVLAGTRSDFQRNFYRRLASILVSLLDVKFMRTAFDRKPLFLLNGLLIAFGILFTGFLLVSCLGKKAPPVVRPFVGAPVTATVEGKMLVIANDSDNVIYHLTFPTEILPAIEWAPCIAPETCPIEQRIDSGKEKRLALSTVVREQTVSITVFWWIYLEKVPGASVPPLEMHEIRLPLP